MAQIWWCCGCGIEWQLKLRFNPSPETAICCRFRHKKKISTYKDTHAHVCVCVCVCVCVYTKRFAFFRKVFPDPQDALSFLSFLPTSNFKVIYYIEVIDTHRVLYINMQKVYNEEPCTCTSILRNNHFFFFLFLSRATPAAYWSSQARGLTGATAADLSHRHSHSVGSKPCLQTTQQLTVTPDPWPTEWSQGWNPHPCGH